MRLIKEPNKLKKVIEPKPMTQQEIDEISTTLLQELTKVRTKVRFCEEIWKNPHRCTVLYLSRLC